MGFPPLFIGVFVQNIYVRLCFLKPYVHNDGDFLFSKDVLFGGTDILPAFRLAAAAVFVQRVEKQGRLISTAFPE